jgi:DNA polymerase (family 10)
VHILGHPTGRLLGRRRGLEPDLEALFSAAASCDTALELNANPRRLDLPEAALRGALRAGCKIAINTDAHAASQFEYLSYGVRSARRAGMAAESCINTWDPTRLSDWLRAKRS